RPAGRLQHLERTDDPLRIARPQARGHLRVAPLQHPMEGCRSDTLRFCAPVRTDLAWNGWDGRQALQQGLEVKPGPADENRQPPLRLRLRQGALGIAHVTPGRISLARRHEAVKCMRYPRLLIRSRPRSQDAQLAVD